MPSEILLTISVMASNRRDTTEKCLQSLTHLRKVVPCELIITDTGCDPDMRALVESYADRVIEFTWCQDFAKARQASLDVARGEWYLYLDDDEWFIDTDELEQFFLTDQHKNVGVATYIQRNYHDWEGVDYADAWVSRMIKMAPGVHFEDKIHEHLEPVKGLAIAAISSIVEHYGYIYKSDEDKINHSKRNMNLLLEMLEENPQNMRTRIHLAQEYNVLKEYQKLRELAQESLSLLKNNPELESETDISGLYASLAVAIDGLKEYDQHEENYQMALADGRVAKTTLAYLSLLQAHGCLQGSRDYEKARKCCETYLNYKQLVELNPANQFVESLSVFSGNALGEKNEQRCYAILFICDLKKNDLSHACEYIEKMGWTGNDLYIYPGILELLADSILQNPTDDWKPVLQKLTQGQCIWMYVSEAFLQVRNQSEEEYQKFAKLIAGLESGRVSCELEMNYCKEKMCAGMSGKSLSERKQIMLNYADAALLIKDKYAVAEFEEDYTIAAYLKAAFETESEEEKIRNLHELVMKVPEMAQLVKNYLMLENEEKRQIAEMQKNEMEKLKLQVLSQANVLIEQGQTEAAKQVVAQLKQIMPQDLEVAEIALQLSIGDLG